MQFTLPLTTRSRKLLRQIAHHLDAIVSIGEQGTTDAVIAETQRALKDHELIKVRLHSGDRELREQQIQQLLQGTGAASVQQIGKVIAIYLPNPEANPKLSNVARFAP